MYFATMKLSPLFKLFRQRVEDSNHRFVGCELLRFTSEMKSLFGTGWPSFFEHVQGHMLTELDFKLIWP